MANQVGGWSGENRSTAERVADYDWDNTLLAAGAEIAELIAGNEVSISQTFWKHYLALPMSAHIRPMFDEAYLAASVADSARYTIAKYSAPHGDEWAQMATHHVARSQKAGIPLQALLASLSFAHSCTLGLIEAKLGTGSPRFRALADAVQRLALVEADIMASHLGTHDAQRSRAERRDRSAHFSETIATSIEGTAGGLFDPWDDQQDERGRRRRRTIRHRDARGRADRRRADPCNRAGAHRSRGGDRDRDSRLDPGRDRGMHVGNAQRPCQVDRIDPRADP
jgi:hypothetical protein